VTVLQAVIRLCGEALIPNVRIKRITKSFAQHRIALEN
jgi:hypothetical protein